MLNHNNEIINPKHWTNLVSPRSKLSMHFCCVITSLPIDRVILPADFVLDVYRQVGEGDDDGNDGGFWKIPGDGKVGYLSSKGIWIELKDAGGMGRNQLRMDMGGQRRLMVGVRKLRMALLSINTRNRMYMYGV